MSTPQSRPASPPSPKQSDLLDSILCFADFHYAKQNWQPARDFLSLAVQVAPDNGQIHAALGSLQYQLQDYPAALISFSTAAQLNPKDADLQTQLAMAFLQNNRTGAAEAVLAKATELCPDSIAATKLLADIKLSRSRWAEAAALYGKLINKHPDQVTVFLSLAKCFYGVGDMEGVEATLGQVLTLDPTNEIAKENLLVLRRGMSPQSPSA